MMRIRIAAIAMLFAVGCAHEYNPTQSSGEEAVLTHTMQLTRGFERAGEAYFSPDMSWIIFQATPRGEKQYQMFVAPVQYNVGPRETEVARNAVSPGPIRMEWHDIIGIGTP